MVWIRENEIEKMQNYSPWIQQDICVHIAKNVETKFDTSSYELERPLPKDKNKKVNGLMKNELGGNATTKLAALGQKHIVI